MYCNQCGSETNEDAIFCKNCGNKLNDTPSINKESFPGNTSETKNVNKFGYPSSTKQNVASQGARFANLILDYIFYYLFAVAFGFLLGVSGFYDLLGIDYWNETFLGLIIMLIFYILFESIWQKTPAKFITRTRVVSQRNGTSPSFGAIIIRTLSRFIPFEPFSFFGSKNPIGWHDRLSKTIVISDK